MSDAGSAQAPTQVPAPWIKSDRLRDFVAAFNTMARPATIYMGGIACMVAVFITPGWDTASIAAGMATGVSYFKSKDNQAAIGKQ